MLAFLHFGLFILYKKTQRLQVQILLLKNTTINKGLIIFLHETADLEQLSVVNGRIPGSY